MGANPQQNHLGAVETGIDFLGSIAAEDGLAVVPRLAQLLPHHPIQVLRQFIVEALAPTGTAEKEADAHAIALTNLLSLKHTLDLQVNVTDRGLLPGGAIGPIPEAGKGDWPISPTASLRFMLYPTTAQKQATSFILHPYLSLSPLAPAARESDFPPV